ncbi:MAG TPA: ferredoxin [Pseudonocardiaceae bacterium]|jgi:ferredoxin|nr:ferredoxin [Pseudonocardiaceae bacterium]
MTSGRWQISVGEACIGSAVCAGTLPNRFTIVGDRSVPVDSEIDPDQEVLDTAEACPMEAIRVVEKESGRVLAPEE